MCENYKLCLQPSEKISNRPFTRLLLDCWQREYDKRPYRKFRFNLLEFEERLRRKFHPVYDFLVIVSFLKKRALCTVRLTGIHLLPYEHDVLQSFIESLVTVCRIELRLMQLPTRFFELLGDRAAHMNVKELILEGTILTTPDIEALHKFIIESKILRHLNVSNCSVTQYNFPLLADAIHKSNSMRSFVCNRLIGKRITLDTFKIAHVVSSLIWQNKLKELEMQNCEFQSRDMEVISEYLETSKSSMRKLNFAYNCIGCDGTEYIFRAVVLSNTLTHLNIGGNKLGTNGGRTVAKYLSSCYLLIYLNITWNQISSDAMNLILTTIKKPIKLHRIEIIGNQFDGKSASILRRLLDAGVLPQEGIDVVPVYDDSIADYRVTRYD
ncbi:protein NLRC3 isoform X1 [Bactrocera dorsalis]|uniref:protein NLRC3 isoform X1 n=1 Tax=Bactrocera dorsalis TaxID=27457 RepID=A0A034VQY8_BACDO|nr:protein NLRC3 isoform X1 [Bactrocera dorsalis]